MGIIKLYSDNTYYSKNLTTIVDYDAYLPFIGTVVVIGIILNSLTLSYFIWRNLKTIWNKLYILLNIIDLGINVSGAVIVGVLITVHENGKLAGLLNNYAHWWDETFDFTEDGIWYLLIIVSQVYTFFIMCAAFLVAVLGAAGIISYTKGHLAKVERVYKAITYFALFQLFVLILSVTAWFIGYINYVLAAIAGLNLGLECIFLIAVFVICAKAILTACNPPPKPDLVIYNTQTSNNSGMRGVHVEQSSQPSTEVEAFTKIRRHTLVTIIWLMALFLVFEITGLILMILLFAGVTHALIFRSCLLHLFIFRPIRTVFDSTLFFIREKTMRDTTRRIMRC